MKKALLVILLYSVALVLMGSASIRFPERCSSFKDFRGLETSSQTAHGHEFEGYVCRAAPEIKASVSVDPVEKGCFKKALKLEACTAWIIPLVWKIHYQCAADAYGGGGGRAF